MRQLQAGCFGEVYEAAGSLEVGVGQGWRGLRCLEWKTVVNRAGRMAGVKRVGITRACLRYMDLGGWAGDDFVGAVDEGGGEGGRADTVKVGGDPKESIRFGERCNTAQRGSARQRQRSVLRGATFLSSGSLWTAQSRVRNRSRDGSCPAPSI